jgi:hypothetical protein
MKTQIMIAAAMLMTTSAQAGPLSDLAYSLFVVPGAKSTVPVLSPGAKLNINGHPGGKTVVVFGDDACPNSEPASDGCIVVNKPVVTVHWLDGGRKVTEQWKVVKKGQATYMARPGGTLVSRTG